MPTLSIIIIIAIIIIIIMRCRVVKKTQKVKGPVTTSLAIIRCVIKASNTKHIAINEREIGR